jgi:VIT1/CCC1 family predicted Fe2+/Mn2+ transporter
MTGITFFLIGSVKSRWSTASWIRSGLETLFVGTLAAVLAYAVGVFLKGLTS